MKTYKVTLCGHEYIVTARSAELAHLDAINQHQSAQRTFTEQQSNIEEINDGTRN